MRVLFCLRGIPACGKAQPLDSLIMYADGIYRPMQDVKIGDLIIDGLGKVTKVIGVFPQGYKDVYEIHTNDGRIAQASGDHLWKVRTRKMSLLYHRDGNDKHFKVITTEELLQDLNNDPKFRVRLPICSINDYKGTDSNFKIPPYLLGALLGDGCMTSVKNLYFSNTEDDIINKVSTLITATYNGLELVKNKNTQCQFIVKYHKGMRASKQKQQLMQDLTDLGLLGKYSHTKFIPKQYLLASIGARKELLAGLFDTDGYVSPQGCYSYSTTSYDMAQDVIYLCRSIGYIVTIYIDKREGRRDCYNISLHTNDSVFTSVKHCNRPTKLGVLYNDHIYVDSVKLVGKKECQCIMVDSDDQTYITNDFIVTHNTTFIKDNDLQPFTLSSDDYREKLGGLSLTVGGEVCRNQSVNKIVWKRFNEDLTYRLSMGETTIVDATNISLKELNKYKKLAKEYNYRMYVVDFTDVPLSICLHRNEQREYDFVPEEYIIKKSKQLSETVLPKSIEQISPKRAVEVIERIYDRMNMDDYDVIHVIGDIHGCGTVLNKYLDEYVDKTCRNAFIFVGDYFDRGIENDVVFKRLYKEIGNDDFILLKGNHEETIERYLRGEDMSHKHFVRKTLPQLQLKAGVTDKMLKSFCKNLRTCANFTFEEVNFLVTHGGISNCNIPLYMLSEHDIVHGIGEYDDIEDVCTSYSYFAEEQKEMFGNRFIQIMGHRNPHNIAIKVDEHNYNVNDVIEAGGDLRVVVITKNGIHCESIKNEVFSPVVRLKKLENSPELFRDIDVEQLVGAYRQSKYVKESMYMGRISSFNFTVDAFEDDVWNGVTTRARGMFIDTLHYNIVARSFDKFFNLGQHECSSYSTVKQTFVYPLTGYEKYDGFLGILGYDKFTDSITYHSKSTISPFGDYANLFRSKLEPLITAKEELKNVLKTRNISLVFECVAPKEDKHIIDYKEDKVVLLKAIHNEPVYNPFANDSVLERIAGMYFNGVKVKEKVFVINSQDEFDETIAKWKETAQVEGYVIEDAIGENMVKLKTYQYEGRKLCRNIYDYYAGVSKRTIDKDIKLEYPNFESFKERYSPYYKQIYVTKAYEIACMIVDYLNDNNMDITDFNIHEKIYEI